MSVKRGLVLMNLGSPETTSVKDLRKYLNEFLMDERVIDIPFLLRTLLVRGIIVPFRAPKSAAAYKTVWWPEGSPLMEISRRLQQAVQERLDYPVTLSMRYGNPTPEAAIDVLSKANGTLDELILFPLYPHCAMSSYETAVEHFVSAYKKGKYSFSLKTVPPFYNDPGYIYAMAENMRSYLQNDYDHLLFSYHGIPERHIRKSDVTGSHCLQSPDCCSVPSPAHKFCYRHQCFTTTKLIAEKLGIPADKYSISFQSRLGKGWLQPFTDIRLEQMPSEGIKKLVVICPAFVSDCLETLEEIADRGRESFMEAGGESYNVIPCLNDNAAWVDALVNLVKKEESAPVADPA